MLRSLLFSPSQRCVKVTSKPAILSAKSTDLLEKGGYIRQAAVGTYGFMPLGLRLLETIVTIIDKHMKSINGQKIQMPILTSAELWKATKRWDTIGNELMRIQDRHGVSYCLGPTHEEAFTELIANSSISNKILPLKLYQISTKYRDEIRPRHGLIRCREFLMKDMYSFDMTEEGALATYQEVFECYKRLFEELKLPVHPVAASSGSIGGSLTHEFQVALPIGEDEIVTCACGKIACNKEMAHRKIDNKTPIDILAAIIEADSGNKENTIVEREQISQYLTQKLKNNDARVYFDRYLIESSKPVPVKEVAADIPETRTRRAKKKVSKNENETSSVAVQDVISYSEMFVFRSSQRKVNQVAIQARVIQLGSRVMEDPDFSLIDTQNTTQPLYFFDYSLFDICDLHQGNTGAELESLSGTETLSESKSLWGEFTEVMSGDKCADPDCTSADQSLNMERGVEVGQTFYLGKKYSECFNASVHGSNSLPVTLEMGCYGIGVTRIMQTLAEYYHSPAGLRWPLNLAPYLLCIIPLQSKYMDDARDLAKSISSWWPQCENKIILDDRVKMKFMHRIEEAKLMGIPFTIAIGEKWIETSSLYFVTHSIHDPEEVPHEGYTGFSYVKNYFKSLNEKLTSTNKE